MSLAQMWTGPVVVLAVFLVLALACIVFLVIRRSAEISDQMQANRLRRVVRDQDDVITAVIGELETRPATYAGFPKDVEDALYAAHTKANGLDQT